MELFKGGWKRESWLEMQTPKPSSHGIAGAMWLLETAKYQSVGREETTG